MRISLLLRQLIPHSFHSIPDSSPSDSHVRLFPSPDPLVGVTRRSTSNRFLSFTLFRRRDGGCTQQMHLMWVQRTRRGGRNGRVHGLWDCGR